MEIDTMNRTQLRAACKENGIRYTKLTVAGMRAALALVVNGDTKPAIEEVTTPAPEKKATPKAEREEQNGIKRPLKPGACLAVWEWCEDQYGKTGIAPKPADARAHAAKAGWNESNAAQEASAWRRFHGYTKPKK